MSDTDDDLDPRIQIELEKLNSTTDEINKLEIEYDEGNTTFRMLLNESTRRLKLLSKKLGNCIDKSRPYYEALEVAKKAQQQCQQAAVVYQRASEVHAAAKETVALAEQRFLSNQHKWQFDNAWQEMLNHATIKVMEAENQKADSGREHQKRATLFKTAEEKVKQLEDSLHKHLIKSRPYFDEKSLCQEQLNTQKERIETIKCDIIKAKTLYADTLKRLEQISNEIHLKRGSMINDEDLPKGPREPGVGAELVHCHEEIPKSVQDTLPNIKAELDKCEMQSPESGTNSSALSEIDETENRAEELNDLKVKFKELAIRPVNGCEGKSTDEMWESELKETADAMDHLLLMQECAKELDNYESEINSLDKTNMNSLHD